MRKAERSRSKRISEEVKEEKSLADHLKSAYDYGISDGDKKYDAREIVDAFVYDKSTGSNYVDGLNEVVTAGRECGLYKDYFHVVVLCRPEIFWRCMKRFSRMHRKSCPTPAPSQTVFLHHIESGKTIPLWTLPTRSTIARTWSGDLRMPPTHKQLEKMIVLYKTGKLLAYAKWFNGETKEKPPEEVTRLFEGLNLIKKN